MSQPKYLLQKPSLPEDDYTVIARLVPFLDRPYDAGDAASLTDALQLQPNSVELLDHSVYVRLHLGYLAGEAVWKEAAYSLQQGLGRLSINPQIDAGADSTRQVINAPALSIVFPHLLHDISIELSRELSYLAGQPVMTFDFDAELRQLADL